MSNSFLLRSAAIVGGGTMGTDIAAIFIAGGWAINIVEPLQDRWSAALARIAQSVEQLGHSPKSMPIRMHPHISELPWNELGILIECIPEQLELKRSLFAQMENFAPASLPLASNSSSIPISEISRGLKTRERMLGLHFFMPAHLVPAVEVVRGEATDPVLCERCSGLMRSLGKVPVNVKKDVPGFLANRLQHALAREAFAMIDAGLASAEDIDAAVRFGFGLRYLAAGPVLQKDIAGLDIHCAAARTMYPSLANNTVPSAALSDKVAAGKLGMKTGEGFYRWTPESAAREKARYEQALLGALELLKPDMPS
ncbi:MAG: 3-hydroxyacyl-CoA dehydrogenase [Betaproteobacteria bacterium RIFCSPLOWO2_02_FULL_62_17]|nr:MAG: 3-hydroxyacyl-CoA dehydrogenase [Betaproteobacteria bacterium RIFCSPLOWO2_02_FULL_62_17]